MGMRALAGLELVFIAAKRLLSGLFLRGLTEDFGAVRSGTD